MAELTRDELQEMIAAAEAAVADIVAAAEGDEDGEGDDCPIPRPDSKVSGDLCDDHPVIFEEIPLIEGGDCWAGLDRMTRIYPEFPIKVRIVMGVLRVVGKALARPSRPVTYTVTIPDGPPTSPTA